MNARPRPSPVRLTLDQRRAIPICELFSARMGREVIVPSVSYWFALWLEWATTVTAYVELPANTDVPGEWLAGFWVEWAGDEFLIDVELGEELPSTRPAADPWALQTEGFEPASAERNARITARWLWARRSVLLHLEQAHPFAVAARLQGGLKAHCKRLLTGFPQDGEDLFGLCQRTDASSYMTECAALHLVRMGELIIDWRGDLSMSTRFNRRSHAPKD